MEEVPKAGYSILIYDRLGIGQSDKPDGNDIVQAPVHLEILRQLTVLARDGKLLPPGQQQLTIPKFEKVVLVGHSFGSFLTIGFLSSCSSTVDGAVSTGFIQNDKSGLTGQRAFGWEYAPESDYGRFGDRSSGYSVQGTTGSIQQNLLQERRLRSRCVSICRTKQRTSDGWQIDFFQLSARSSGARFLRTALSKSIRIPGYWTMENEHPPMHIALLTNNKLP